MPSEAKTVTKAEQGQEEEEEDKKEEQGSRAKMSYLALANLPPQDDDVSRGQIGRQKGGQGAASQVAPG